MICLKVALNSNSALNCKSKKDINFTSYNPIVPPYVSIKIDAFNNSKNIINFKWITNSIKKMVYFFKAMSPSAKPKI